MKKPVIIAVVALGLALSAGWYVAAQSTSGDALPAFAPGDTLMAADLNAIVEGVQSTLAAVNGTGGTTITVDCDTGGATALADAIQAAAPGSTITVTGTCNEAVTITKDGLTLDGQNQTTTTIDGGGQTDEATIHINGAQRVTIKNMTIQNGFHGIHAQNGAAVTVDNVMVTDNADDGIMIRRHATATLMNVTVQQSGDNGIVVTGVSHATFEGSIVSDNNGDDGIIIWETSNASFTEATVQTNNNVDSGLNITVGSSAYVGESTFTMQNNVKAGMRLNVNSAILCVQSSISAPQNMGSGIVIRQGSALDLFNCMMSATSNTNDGIFITDNASVVLSGSAGPNTIAFDNNGDDGLHVQRASKFDRFDNGTMTITGNTQDGVAVDDGASITINNATITGNGGSDVNVLFGSRATLNTNTIGTITCDGTALSRGTTVCP